MGIATEVFGKHDALAMNMQLSPGEILPLPLRNM